MARGKKRSRKRRAKSVTLRRKGRLRRYYKPVRRVRKRRKR